MIAYIRIVPRSINPVKINHSDDQMHFITPDLFDTVQTRVYLGLARILVAVCPAPVRE